MIVTGHLGTNSGLIAEAARLYIENGDWVADVTFGRGVFWRNVDTRRFALFASDIGSGGENVRMDFRSLAYGDGLFHHLVLDPPYMHGGATVKPSIARCYGNRKTGYASHAGILDLYVGGIREASRVLRPCGKLWVKCQDEIESGRQRWTHIEIKEAAAAAGFIAKDLFVLVQKQTPAKRAAHQYHARKNHSYLWIFEKAKSSKAAVRQPYRAVAPRPLTGGPMPLQGSGPGGAISTRPESASGPASPAAGTPSSAASGVRAAWNQAAPRSAGVARHRSSLNRLGPVAPSASVRWFPFQGGGDSCQSGILVGPRGLACCHTS